MEKNNILSIIGLVAIVAIVGMVVAFAVSNKGSSQQTEQQTYFPTEEDYVKAKESPNAAGQMAASCDDQAGWDWCVGAMLDAGASSGVATGYCYRVFC